MPAPFPPWSTSLDRLALAAIAVGLAAAVAAPMLAAGLPATWSRAHAGLRATGGGPVWPVLPPDASPTVGALLARIRERHPGTRVVWHEALDHRAAYQ